MTKELVELGVSLIGLSLLSFAFAWWWGSTFEYYQWQVNKEGIEAIINAGVILLIIGSILLVLDYILLKFYIKEEKIKQSKRQSEPVRQKSCPSCGTDISFLAICPKCGHVVKIK